MGAVIITNPFAKALGVPLPTCCSLGACCKGASPSTPYHQLLKRAATGDDFARGFFSIMVPYASHQEAERVVPGIVERSLRAVRKLKDFQGEQDVVFYHCRYQTEDNKCGVWEDRPQFCRDYPDTPFVVMAPGCAFEGWGKACREKYQDLQRELAHLKALRESLNQHRRLQEASGGDPAVTSFLDEFGAEPSPLSPDLFSAGAALSLDASAWEQGPALQAYELENLSLVLSLTDLYVSSPLRSLYFLRFVH